MPDYDINKVSLRPWIVSGGNTIRPKGLFPAVLTISKKFAEYPYEEHIDNLEHIVHCVNAHDSLLQFVRDIAGEDRGTSIETRDAARALLKQITTRKEADSG